MPGPTKASKVHTLISYYLAAYTQRYGETPASFNRNAVRVNFEGMLDDLGIDRAKVIIDDYFTTQRPDHPANYLLYNYHTMNKRLLDIEADDAERMKLREETRRMVEQIEGT